MIHSISRTTKTHLLMQGKHTQWLTQSLESYTVWVKIPALSVTSYVTSGQAAQRCRILVSSPVKHVQPAAPHWVVLRFTWAMGVKGLAQCLAHSKQRVKYQLLLVIITKSSSPSSSSRSPSIYTLHIKVTSPLPKLYNVFQISCDQF